MKALIVTLQYKVHVEAIRSHIQAATHWQNAGIRFDWLHVHGMPDSALLPNSAEGHDIVTAKYIEARETFLAGDYDVFIAIEDDMIIPVDTFPRLVTALERDADVAYGLYCWRRGSYAWSAYTDINEDKGKSISRHDRERAIQAFTCGEVMQVAGVGMGCTAIRRDALARIPFERRDHACNDWYFAVDAKMIGLVSVCDFGLVCGHITTERGKQVIYPAVNDNLYRVEYL